MIGKLFFDKKGDALYRCVTYIGYIDSPTEVHLSSREGFTDEQIKVASEYCMGRGVKLVISKYIAPYNIFVAKRNVDDSKSIFEKTSQRNTVL